MDQSQGIAMAEAELRRVSDEIRARLNARWVETTDKDSPHGLASLMEAVEEFEATVERKGGDLMVDEPVRSGRPAAPDDASFVLPARNGGETLAGYIARVMQARDRAEQAPSRASGRKE